ncbi:UvrD-helicase domain-containing protein [Embleya sp. NPDC008237]|uniref:UvrD-helicase domain-containing protein n=1 Tax=Embleya sp. NPDC008237 TaxID=3363978 RepID=UPI0036E1E1AE
MSDQSATDAQRRLATSPVGTFAVACPGAGKTRAIVARFLVRTREESRRGVALVSFTNTAIDEVRRRCVGRDDAIRAPHFVGTFDGFLHRFIVTPLFPHVFRVAPRYVQSWADVRGASFRLRDAGRSPDVRLAWFDFGHHGEASLCLDRVPQRLGSFREVLSARSQEVEQRVSKVYCGLLAAGTVGCEAARVPTSRFLTHPRSRGILRETVGARFVEIIVDEAQDCGEEELAVLRFLQDCGVTVVMVGDPDQSIHEFRRALPGEVLAHGRRLSEFVEMSDNFRSSPAVCSFNNALRSGPMNETSAGPLSHVETPVCLVGYSRPGDIASAVLELGKEHHLGTEELMVPAHRESDAMKAVGQVDPGSLTSKANRILAIADAGFKLRSAEFDARTRLAAITSVGIAIVETLAGTDFGNRSLDTVCRDNGIDPRWLRDFAIRLATTHDAADSDAQPFAAAVRAHLADADWNGATVPTNTTRMFKAPTIEDSAKVTATENRSALGCSTVHRVKGMEFRGVALVLPQRAKPDARTAAPSSTTGKDTSTAKPDEYSTWPAHERVNSSSSPPPPVTSTVSADCSTEMA